MMYRNTKWMSMFPRFCHKPVQSVNPWHWRPFQNPPPFASQSRHFYRGRNPFYEIEQLMKETEQKFKEFDSFLKQGPLFQNPSIQSIIPVYKKSFGTHNDLSTKNKFKLEFNFSGATAEDVTINLKDRLLSITAKVTEKNDFSEKHQEMSFEHTIPENVDLDALHSVLTEDGLLTVEAPIKQQAKSTTINVNRE